MASKTKIQSLSVYLKSMNAPTANEQTLASADNLVTAQGELSQTDIGKSPTNCKLVVNPSVPSEIVVKLKNSSNRSLVTNLRIEGDFPIYWCQIGMEGTELPPHTEMEAVLYFQIPEDFFENQEAIVKGQPLTINYQGQLQVYAGYANETTIIGDSSGLELFGIEPFQLYVRPSSLYLDFLPDIYQEVDFVGRLLKIFEESLEPDVQILDSLWAYLDPMLAPTSMLPFISHWVGWELSPNLDIERQRYLVKQAMQIYRWRGTRKGLRFYIHLFTGLPLDEHLPEGEKHINIFEITGGGFVLGNSQLGQTTTTGGGRPFHFVVRIRNNLQSNLDMSLIHQIINREKPAFCTYELEIS